MPALIVGLGNPDAKYANTRHNVGFFVLDTFTKAQSLSWQEKSKFASTVAEYSEAGEKVLLVKPQTYYNNSGEAVRAIQDFYKIPQENILVIHDDLALPFGTIRTREQGSDAGNNGIKSIIQHIGPDFPRIRIGIWNENRNASYDATYVLNTFHADERKDLEKIAEHITDLIHTFARHKKIPATTWRLEKQTQQ